MRSHQSRTSRRPQRRVFARARAPFVALLVLLVLASGLATTSPIGAQTTRDGLFPWQIADDGPPGAVGAGFPVTIADLTFILTQIKISEQHSLTYSAAEPCSTLIGPGPNQINEGPNAVQLQFGLRTISGVCNNLVPGQEFFGATQQPFERLVSTEYRNAEVSTFDINGTDYPAVGQSTTYDPAIQPAGTVEDSDVRVISNLIVDQTNTNPAAVEIAGLPLCSDVGGVPPCEPFPDGENYDFPNVATDEGLSASFNSAFIFFGQFFDHGLDLTTKTGDLIYMPLQDDDPLCPCGFGPGLTPPFMLLSRATDDGVQVVNLTSPYVDQNQTYTSHPSAQVFLREYEDDGGLPVETGRLLSGTPDVEIGSTIPATTSPHTVCDDPDGPGPLPVPPTCGLASWADVKIQAAALLGIALVDSDSLSVPLLATDLYGNFIPGPVSGLPQIVLADGVTLVEGNLIAPISTAGAMASGHAFLVDIAHHAVATPGLTPDDDTVSCGAGLPGPTVQPFCDDGDEDTYDDEMLDAHFICGDGRCNENIALSSVHHVFHSEHNRLVDDIKNTLLTEATPAFLLEWFDGVWNGKRLFQAAKFVTEMEYQHLAFEEFARKVQPQINVFAGYDETINAAITAEYSQASYRFGHSMLNEEVARFDFRVTPVPEDISLGLIEAFLNPPEFFDGGAPGPFTPNEAAGSIFAGLIQQIGQEIDGFVVDAVRNNLLGLPLDLPSINLARGRDFGLPPLNQVRREIFSQTGNSIWDPYTSWMDLFFNLQNPEQLANIIAAYGTHPLIRTHDPDGAGTAFEAGDVASRRAAVDIILDQPLHPEYPPDASDFLWSTASVEGDWTACAAPDTRTACTDFADLFPNSVISGRTSTGVDHIDLWIGGLVERKEIFGGLLGAVHNYVFEIQLERLQDGDRLYYLHRLVGLPLLAALEGNSFAELIERNSTAELLPADVFSLPTFVFNLEVVNPGPPCPTTNPLVDDPATDYFEPDLLFKEPDGTVRYFGEDHILIAGRDLCDDRIAADEGDDTVRGKGGDDVLEGGGGNDIIVGGLGDDIITDVFGDDDLKGGPGDDAIHGGQGFDLLQGGEGQDFILAGSDPTEIFGGLGNDFILDGDSFGVIFGDPGDDWIEGGGQADLLQGDQAAPFQNNPVMADGNDVMWGQGGNDDYDAEGGDDILVSGPGTERFEGMLGFDWVTAKAEGCSPSGPGCIENGVDYDLDRTFLVPPDIDDIRDRFDDIEGLSGGPGPDMLIGSRRPVPPVLPGDNHLSVAGQALIAGLTDIMPDLSALAFPACPGATTGVTECVWDEGDIILGGPAGDLITGRFGDDILDGDRWLNVQIGGPGGPWDNMIDLTAEVFDGIIDPGDLSIVRTIEPGDGTGTDIAIYGGPVEDYDITNNGDGSFTVDHARGCGGAGPCPEGLDLEPGIDDGTDTLRNFEIVRFLGSTPVLDVTLADCTPLCAPLFSIDDVAMDEGDPEDPGDPVLPPTTFAFTVTRTGDLSPATIDVATADDTATAGTDYAAVSIPGLVFGPGVSSVTVDVLVSLDGDIEPDETFFVNLSNASAGSISDAQGVGTIVDDDAPTDPPGMLRTTTSPALPAQISVDGIPRDTWALTWVEIPPGLHEVCYADVQGYTTPSCETVTVTSGATSTTVGTYTPNGWLRVLTSPALPSTITIGVGDPLNDWGVWTDVAPGDYNVCYGDVAGFDAPACELVTVVAGATTTVTGDFTASAATGPTGFGMLRVTSSPAVPTQISVDGSANDTWSLQWVKMAPGLHEVCFSDVAGFTTPTCQNVMVNAGATTAVVGNFVMQGSLRVITDPAKPSTISVDDIPRNAWGMWTGLEAGSYTVCYSEVEGFTPPCEIVAVVAGALTTVTGVW